MNRSALSLVMGICGALSLAIAVFQLVESRYLWGGLSLIYAGVFVVGSVANGRRTGRASSPEQGRAS